MKPASGEKDKYRGKKGCMSLTNGNEVNHSLLHFHVCIHCKAAFRREDVEGRVHTTGLFICPKCGKEGPLNIEIHEVDDDESQMLHA
jgi:hypothetical protein